MEHCNYTDQSNKREEWERFSAWSVDTGAERPWDAWGNGAESSAEVRMRESSSQCS